MENRPVSELVSWLRAQLDHDERTALAAAEVARGRVWRGSEGGIFSEDLPGGHALLIDGYGGTDEELAAHVALHDPATVLRTVAAHRVILDAYENERDYTQRFPSVQVDELAGLQTALLAVVSIYSDRDGYDPAWTPDASLTSEKFGG